MNIGPSLEDLITEFYSRRQALRGGAGVVGAVMLAGCGDSGGDGDGDAPPGADPAPVLTLSRSGTASAGQTVTLTATVTDNGTIIAMVWRQVSGPAVTLSSTTAAIVSFVVPEIGRAHSELQSRDSISYAVFCLKKKNTRLNSSHAIVSRMPSSA